MVADSKEKAILCRCGYTTDHPWVTENARYSFAGWLMLIIGIHALPVAIERKCHRCGFIFSCSTDPAECEVNRFH